MNINTIMKSMNKYIVIAALITFVFLISCKEKYKESQVIKFVNDSTLIQQVHCKVQAYDSDSTIKINIELENFSDSTVFIPMSEWRYYSNIDKGTSFFKYTNNGLVNIIGFDVKDFVAQDYSFEHSVICRLDNYPYFVEISPRNKALLNIIHPKYFINANLKNNSSIILRPLFRDTVIYTLSVELPLISRYNIEKLFSLSESPVSINSLILKELNITLPKSENMAEIYIYKQSSIQLPKDILRYLDKLGRNKIKSTVDFKLTTKKI